MANRISFVVIAKDAFSSVSRRVSASTKTMTKGFTALGTKLSFITGKFGKLAGAAAAFGATRKLIREGSSFQNSIASLASITGSAGKELEFLREESLRLAKISNFSAKETANAFKLVASAKAELLEDPKALSSITEQTLLLANAAGIPLAESAQIVTESLNQFGAAAADTSRFVNVLAAGSKFGASEVAETGTAIVRAGVAAKLAALSFEDTNAALQVLSKSGIKAERAGTQLKTVLIRLESLTAKKYKPSIVGLDKALENLSKRHLSTNQLTKLFGREAISVGEILISNRDKVAKMRDDITGTGIATEQATINLAIFSSKIRGVGVVINEVFIRTFDKLGEDGSMFQMLDDFRSWVEDIDSSNLSILADTILLVAKALGKLASISVDIAAIIFKPIRNILAFALDLLDDFNDDTRSFKRTRDIFRPQEIVDTDEFSLTDLDDIKEQFKQIKKEKQLSLSRSDIEENPLFSSTPRGAADILEGAIKSISMNADLKISIANESDSKVNALITNKDPNFRVGVNMEPAF